MENISLKDFKDIWEQLDDNRKVEYLMKALQDATQYYPEFVTMIELIGWQMNYKIEKGDSHNQYCE